MKVTSVTNYLTRHATGKAKTDLYRVDIEKGLTWEDAMAKRAKIDDPNEGFYLYKDVSLPAKFSEFDSLSFSLPTSVV